MNHSNVLGSLNGKTLLPLIELGNGNFSQKNDEKRDKCSRFAGTQCLKIDVSTVNKARQNIRSVMIASYLLQKFTDIAIIRTPSPN